MRTLTPRTFWLTLVFAALVGLILRVEVGLKTFISFDEWQHVFMASSARWADLSFELRTNAHPPLFFLLLKPIVMLGNVALYRLISIAAGVGSIVVVGLISRRLFDSPMLQLLCPVVIALSTDAIAISDEIRSYQLAVLFVLLAFLAWLAMLTDPARKYVVAFALCSSLALVTHYSAVFFIGACVTVSLLFARRLRIMIALAIPCIVFAVEYLVHAGAQPMQGYLFDFYRAGTPNENLPSFLLRNSRNFFNLFSPVEIQNATVFLLVLFLLVAAAIIALRNTRNAAVIVFAGVMVLELLAASLADKYPFGGMLRHQYIAGPFLIIAAFAVLNGLITASSQPVQYAISAVVLVASITNLIVEGPKLILYPGVVLTTKEFNSWRSAFPEMRAVYVDHWGVIAYFIHTSDQPRNFVRRIADAAVIDEYQTSQGTEIFYDKSRILFDFSDPAAYRSLAACLRGSGEKELTLLFYSPGGKPLDRSGELEQRITRKAAEQGLITIKVVVNGTALRGRIHPQVIGP